MKKILLTLVVLCCTGVARAQMSEQVSAILQNGDEMTVFYGSTALNQAIAAAPESGAVITLSSGTFNAPTINKRLTIYGCGWYTDAENDIYPTTINGTLTINLPDEVTAPHDVYVEGLYINGISVSSVVDGLSIVKCCYSDISFSKASDRVNIIQSYQRSGSVNGGGNLMIKNSYMYVNAITPFSDSHTILLDHCIIANGYNLDNNARRFNCTNCIVPAGWLNYSTRIWRYCAFSTGSWTMSAGSGNNWFNVKWEEFFSDATNANYSDTRTFTLANPENYIGSDGTEIGLNGGDYPWNKQPRTPIVKDLKLKVEGKQLKVTYDAQVR